jgi:hypothetical protein
LSTDYDTVLADFVTVTKVGFDRYTVTFSRLPGRRFGPWNLAETKRDLQVSALLDGAEARDLVLDAASMGSATRRL